MYEAEFHKQSPNPAERSPRLTNVETKAAFERWRSEAEYEDDVRTMMKILRPHRRERLLGWREHRTRGEQFRVTIAWDPKLQEPGGADQSAGSSPPPETPVPRFCIPRLADVLESILIGSARNQDDLDPQAEFDLYASVVQELEARVRELRSRYE